MAMIDLTSTGANGTPSNFDVVLRTPITLATTPDTQWTVALIQATYWNSIRNIRASFGNNVLKYSADAGTTIKSITIPDGYYQIKQLNKFIQAEVAANGDNLPGNLPPIAILMNGATIRVVITVAAGYQVGWNGPTDQLAALLGFDPTAAGGIIDGGANGIAYEGDLPPDINRGAEKLRFLCNLVQNSWSNGVQSKILYTTTLKDIPGSVVDIDPPTPKYLNIGRSGNATIDMINIRVVDTKGREVDFNGFPVSLTLHFMPADLGTPLYPSK